MISSENISMKRMNFFVDIWYGKIKELSPWSLD